MTQSLNHSFFSVLCGLILLFEGIVNIDTEAYFDSQCTEEMTNKDKGGQISDLNVKIQKERKSEHLFKWGQRP